MSDYPPVTLEDLATHLIETLSDTISGNKTWGRHVSREHGRAEGESMWNVVKKVIEKAFDQKRADDTLRVSGSDFIFQCTKVRNDCLTLVCRNLSCNLTIDGEKIHHCIMNHGEMDITTCPISRRILSNRVTATYDDTGEEDLYDRLFRELRELDYTPEESGTTKGEGEMSEPEVKLPVTADETETKKENAQEYQKEERRKERHPPAANGKGKKSPKTKRTVERETDKKTETAPPPRKKTKTDLLNLEKNLRGMDHHKDTDFLGLLRHLDDNLSAVLRDTVEQLRQTAKHIGHQNTVLKQYVQKTADMIERLPIRTDRKGRLKLTCKFCPVHCPVHLSEIKRATGRPLKDRPSAEDSLPSTDDFPSPHCGEAGEH